MRWQSVRTIQASAPAVFRLIADPVEFQRAIGADPNVEFLSERHNGVGTRFRASRVNKGKAMSFEHEVTEYVPGQLVRMKNITHGVLWDSSLTVRPSGSASVLTLAMEAHTQKPFQRLLMRFIARTVQRALDKDLSAIAAYAEQPRNNDA